VEALPLTLALYLEGIGELIRDCPLTLTLPQRGEGSGKNLLFLEYHIS
jgi:hypothetical protein